MSHSISSEFGPESGRSEFSSEPEPTQKVPAAPPPPPGPPWLSRWVALIALAVAVIAVALAAWSLLRPPKASTPAPTDQQVADAKTHICAAFTAVHTAVALQTHADLGTDPVAVQAVAANARLAMAAGGSYLLARLEPATPPDLAAAIRSFANGLQDIAVNAMAGVPNNDPAQAARLQDAQANHDRLANLCK